MKKLKIEQVEDEVDEVSEQKDGFESKSESMVLNTHSLTTKNGSSRDILINLSTPFPPQRPESYSEKCKVTEQPRYSAFASDQKSIAFQLRLVSLRVGVCQTAVAAALRSTLLTEVFSPNQLILFDGEVVHDYDKNGAREGLQNLRLRSAKRQEAVREGFKND